MITMHEGKTLDAENARTLLEICQDRNNQRLAIMHQYTNYAILSLSAIWALFGGAYLDSILTNKSNLILLIIPIAFSITVTLFWRFYAHIIDNKMAEDYNKIISLEKVLFKNHNEVPHFSALSGIITGCGSLLKPLLVENNLNCYPQQQEIAKKLIENRLIGDRGQKLFDIVASVVIFILTVMGYFSFIVYLNSQNHTDPVKNTIIYAIFTVVLVLLPLWILHRNPNGRCPIQRNPTEKQIINIIENKPVYSNDDNTLLLLIIAILFIILFIAFIYCAF